MFVAIEKLGLREFRALLIGIGLVVTSILLTATLVPNLKAYLAAAKAVALLELVKKDGGNLEQHLQERQAKIEELKYRLHGDLADLPLKQVEAYVIGRLQNISWQNEVELVSVEPTAGQQVQIFREMLFKIELIGRYEDIYGWLWDAKNELGFVVVKDYSISRRDNIDINPRLHAEVSLASYRAEE